MFIGDLTKIIKYLIAHIVQGNKYRIRSISVLSFLTPFIARYVKDGKLEVHVESNHVGQLAKGW